MQFTQLHNCDQSVLYNLSLSRKLHIIKKILHVSCGFHFVLTIKGANTKESM